MHIYNWYHSNVTGIHYVHEYRLQYIWRLPLAFYLPLLIPFCSPFWPLFTYMETLLAVTGSAHLGLRLLVNWLPISHPLPQSLPPPNSRNPGYQRPTMTTLRIWHLLFGTITRPKQVFPARLAKQIIDFQRNLTFLNNNCFYRFPWILLKTGKQKNNWVKLAFFSLPSKKPK